MSTLPTSRLELGSTATPGAIAIARELVLLGVESMLLETTQRLPSPAEGFVHEQDRWAQVGEQMQAWIAGEPRVDARDAELRRRLVDELGLDPASVWLVVIAATAELHPEVAAALAILAEDDRRQLPTLASVARLLRAALALPFSLTLAELLGPRSPIGMGLVELAEPSDAHALPLTQRGLRLVTTELAALLQAPAQLGASRGDAWTRELPSLEPCYPAPLVAGAIRLLSEHGIVALRGGGRAGRQLALDLASARGLAMETYEADNALPRAGELARAHDALLVLDLCGLDPATVPRARALERLASRFGDLVLLVGPKLSLGAIPTIDAPAIGRWESERAWREIVDQAPVAARLAQQFRIGRAEARAARREARVQTLTRGDAAELEPEQLALAVREQGARRMGHLVTRLSSTARFDDLIVPPDVESQLRDIIAWHRAAPRVEQSWTLPVAGDRGRGLSCLFSGSPGTGKTFAAQCIASELGLNLYRIDLSQVVSKWLGETEKALARVFDEAEAGHGILLFDEADALFGKRTEVKDAHDRYANVEVGYLLQRMEAFSGLAILTTNLRANIDPAFVRRLRFVVEFSLPDRDHRRELWGRALPGPERWAEALDLTPLIERFRLSGGLIHNIGLAATHLAAAEGETLGIDHVVLATYRELDKAGLARSAADFGPYAELLPHFGGQRESRRLGNRERRR